MAWMVSWEGVIGIEVALLEEPEVLDLRVARGAAVVSGKGRAGLSILPLGLRGIRARGT